MKTKTVIAIIFLGIFTVFILQNTITSDIRFFFWKLTLSRAVLLLGALFTGIFIGLFIGWEASAKKKKSSRSR